MAEAQIQVARGRMNRPDLGGLQSGALRLGQRALNFFYSATELFEDGSMGNRRGESAQLFDKILRQLRLRQNPRPFGREVPFHRGGADFQATQPAAETDEGRHFFIAQVDHGLFDVGLGGDQFSPDTRPASGATQFGQAGAMTDDPVGYAQPAGLSYKYAPQFIHEALLLCGHDEEPVCDQSPENERLLLAPGGTGGREFPPELGEGERFELVELLEDVLDPRRRVAVYAQFFPLMSRLTGWFFLGGGRPGQGEGSEAKTEHDLRGKMPRFYLG